MNFTWLALLLTCVGGCVAAQSTGVYQGDSLSLKNNTAVIVLLVVFSTVLVLMLIMACAQVCSMKINSVPLLPGSPSRGRNYEAIFTL